MIKIIKYLISFVVITFLVLCLIGLFKTDDVDNIKSKKSSNYKIGHLEKSAPWVDDYTYSLKMLEALENKNVEYLEEQSKLGNIHILQIKTIVEIDDTENDEIKKIHFKEGKNEGKEGYTSIAFIKYEQNQNKIEEEMIQKAMLTTLIKETDDFYNLIQKGDINEIENQAKEYAKYIEVLKKGYNNENVIIFRNIVLKIIEHRQQVLENYLNYIGSQQVGAIDSAEKFKNLMHTNLKKAEELEQSFKTEFNIK